MTVEHTAEERDLAREIRSLQRDRWHHLQKAKDKAREIAELKALLASKLQMRGIKRGAAGAQGIGDSITGLSTNL